MFAYIKIEGFKIIGRKDFIYEILQPTTKGKKSVLNLVEDRDKDKDRDKNILLGVGSFWPRVFCTGLGDSQSLVCLRPWIVEMLCK